MKKFLRKQARRGCSILQRVGRLWMLRIIWPLTFWLGSGRPVNPNLVLFASELEHTPGDNFRPLMSELSKHGYECIFFGVQRRESRFHRHLRLLRFFWQYATARAVFLVDSFSPINCQPPRRGSVLVQLWHGCGAFKKFGYSTVELQWGPSARMLRYIPIHQNYTWVSSSSDAVTAQLAEAYGCSPAVIQPWGVPRTDYYYQEGVQTRARERLLEEFPEIGRRKVLLYAPTFRGNSMKKARHDEVLDYEALQAAFSQDYVLLLKPHPRARKLIRPPEAQREPFVFDAMDLPIELLLCAADVVISDYSSLIFEYSILERPMLFFSYDLEEYDASRSFYFPYRDFVPGDIVHSSEALTQALQALLSSESAQEKAIACARTFRETYMSACDGHSTERILKKIFPETFNINI